MYPNENEITLSNLHPDIIRIVIKVGEEYMEEMLMISKSWNILVHEVLNSRNGLLPVEQFFIQRYPSGYFKAWVEFDKKDACRLRMIPPGWRRIYDSDIPKNRIVFDQVFQLAADPCEIPKLNRRYDLLLGNRISFADPFKKESSQYCTSNVESEQSEIPRNVRLSIYYLRELFLRCSGIETLVLADMTVSDVTVLSKTLRNVPVNKFVLNIDLFDKEYRTCILEVMRHVNTKRFVLEAHYCTRTNLREFLLKISKMLLMFKIAQGYRDNKYYGLPRYFWEAISRQMIDNGLHHFQFSGQGILMDRSRLEDSLPVSHVKVRMDESF